MSTEDDAMLMQEINEQADRAERNKTQEMDLRALAMTLHGHFDHRDEEDILTQLRTVFRSRGLFWRE